jgi:cardiolipin synthase
MDRQLIREAGAIPNIFGYLRILLVPEFMWLCILGENYAALMVLAISAISDFLDGRAARGLGMVTPLGKVLDPVADKLTQLAVIGCLAAEHWQVMFLFLVLASKEISAAVCSAILLQSGGKPFSSLWFGKISTGSLYIYAGLLLGARLSDSTVLWLTTAASVIVLLAFVLYTFEFLQKIMDIRNNTPR